MGICINLVLTLRVCVYCPKLNVGHHIEVIENYNLSRGTVCGGWLKKRIIIVTILFVVLSLGGTGCMQKEPAQENCGQNSNDAGWKRDGPHIVSLWRMVSGYHTGGDGWCRIWVPGRRHTRGKNSWVPVCALCDTDKRNQPCMQRYMAWMPRGGLGNE